mgnify:CR=1 FL=1
MSARFPNKFLVWSMVFILLGFVLLLWTLGAVPGLSSLWPLIPLLGGLAFLYMGMLRDGSESYVLVGMILALGGLFVLLSNTVLSTVALERTWPVFMTIAGISLFVYALRIPGESRLTLTVPSIALILLSGIFLSFSLDLVDRDFVRVVAMWWPILFVLFGLVLLIIHFVRRSR